MSDLFDLTGSVALVVGAGGLGCAQALGLVAHGADLIAADHEMGRAARLADQARDAGRRALALVVEVTDEASVDRMVGHAVREFGRIDVLVNAAGINIRWPDSTSFPMEEWQRVMDVNTRGTYLCCRFAGKVMIAQRSGSIVNMSSVRGRYGLPSAGAAYCPSKGAVDTLTRTLACEWAPHGVRVNALAPSVIETELTAELLQDPAGAEKLRSRIPMGRWGQPSDVVGPTVFLASRASAFVTGHVLYVDGGLTTYA